MSENLKEPTLMQRKLFVELGRQRSVRQAALAAGFSPRTSTTQIMERLSETTLRGELAELGFDAADAARRIHEGMDARVAKPLGNGDYIDTPDWTNRHRYLQMALRVFGVRVVGPQENVVHGDQNLHLNVYRTVFNMMGSSLETAEEAQNAEVVDD